MKIPYLQHAPFENPGSILSWAKSREWEIACSLLYDYPAGGVPFPPIGDFDWLVIMGGPMNVYEEAKYPWLAEEKAFVKRAIDANKLIVGLCLGAQLFACVLGGKVVKNRYKEIGWLPITLNQKARSLPIFSFLPPNPIVFQWHGDTFSSLPPEAVLLAESEGCKNQAFIYRDRVFAFQFHLENTQEIIQGLLDNCADELSDERAAGGYVSAKEEILSHPEHISQNNRWMDELLDRLEKHYTRELG